jgi:hypothetical protein
VTEIVIFLQKCPYLSDKNLLWNELNIRKKGVMGQKKGTLLITNSNQLYFVKVLGCELQEGVSRKVGCRFHLLLLTPGYPWKPIITGRNHASQANI